MVSRYTPIEDTSGVEKGIFDFSKYGKAVFWPLEHWEDIVKNNLIMFDEIKVKDELN